MVIFARRMNDNNCIQAVYFQFVCMKMFHCLDSVYTFNDLLFDLPQTPPFAIHIHTKTRNHKCKCCHQIKFISDQVFFWASRLVTDTEINSKFRNHLSTLFRYSAIKFNFQLSHTQFGSHYTRQGFVSSRGKQSEWVSLYGISSYQAH